MACYVDDTEYTGLKGAIDAYNTDTKTSVDVMITNGETLLTQIDTVKREIINNEPGGIKAKSNAAKAKTVEGRIKADYKNLNVDLSCVDRLLDGLYKINQSQISVSAKKTKADARRRAEEEAARRAEEEARRRAEAEAAAAAAVDATAAADAEAKAAAKAAADQAARNARYNSLQEEVHRFENKYVDPNSRNIHSDQINITDGDLISGNSIPRPIKLTDILNDNINRYLAIQRELGGNSVRVYLRFRKGGETPSLGCLKDYKDDTNNINDFNKYFQGNFGGGFKGIIDDRSKDIYTNDNLYKILKTGDETNKIEKLNIVDDILYNDTNTVLMTYGYSGTGKTYTLFGDYKEQGIVYKIIDEIQGKKDINRSIEIVKAFILYRGDPPIHPGQNAYINTKQSTEKGKRVEILINPETKGGAPKIPVIMVNPPKPYEKRDVIINQNKFNQYTETQYIVTKTTINEQISAIQEIMKDDFSVWTPNNSSSSRGHLIITFKVNYIRELDRVGFFTVIDLAGLEDVYYIYSTMINLDKTSLEDYFNLKTSLYLTSRYINTDYKIDPNPEKSAYQLINRVLKGDVKPYYQSDIAPYIKCNMDTPGITESKKNIYCRINYLYTLLEQGFFINNSLKKLKWFLKPKDELTKEEIQKIFIDKLNEEYHIKNGDTIKNILNIRPIENVQDLSAVNFNIIQNKTDRTKRISLFINSVINALNNIKGHNLDEVIATKNKFLFEYGIDNTPKLVEIIDFANEDKNTNKYIAQKQYNINNTVQNIPNNKTRTQYLQEYIDELNSNVNTYSPEEIKNELEKREKIEIQKIIIPSLNIKYGLENGNIKKIDEILTTKPIINRKELSFLNSIRKTTPSDYFNDLDIFYKNYNIGKTEQFKPEQISSSDSRLNPADIRNVLTDIRTQLIPSGRQANQYTRYVMFFTFKEDANQDICNYYKTSFEFAKSISSKVASRQAAAPTTKGGRGIRKRVSKKAEEKRPKTKRTSKVRG